MLNILSVSDLDFKYYNNILLSNITFNLHKKTLNAVLGSNNSGKTTLINILSGKITLNKCIEIDNKIVNCKNKKELNNTTSIVYLNSNKKLKFDNYKLLLQYQLRSHGYTIKETKKKILEVSDLFQIKELLNKRISKMDRTDRLKSLIIASMIYEPKILFIDDLDNNDIIIELLKKIIDNYNISILFTTTRLEICKSCDDIFFLNNGTIELTGDFKYICKHDNRLARSGIVISPLLDLSLKLKDYNLLNDIVLESYRMVDQLWK